MYQINENWCADYAIVISVLCPLYDILYSGRKQSSYNKDRDYKIAINVLFLQQYTVVCNNGLPHPEQKRPSFLVYQLHWRFLQIWIKYNKKIKYTMRCRKKGDPVHICWVMQCTGQQYAHMYANIKQNDYCQLSEPDFHLISLWSCCLINPSWGFTWR